MKVLIIGGTGIISTSLVNHLTDLNMDVSVINRGNNNEKLPNTVTKIICDINDEETVKSHLANQTFDTVIDFVAFEVNDVKRDVRLFKNITDQYIFISSASAYQKPPADYPITEHTPLSNPYWDYSENKKACEEFLNTIKDLNITIIRPSHTYNNQMIMAPLTRWQFEYAHLKRLIDGKPVIIPGDGTSLWTITHADDFAASFAGIIGNKLSYNETFHLTSDKLYTWEKLTHIQAEALGVKANIVHIPTDDIVKVLPELKGPLLGDKTWSALFDNSKIKSIINTYRSTINYEDVVQDVVHYYQKNESKQRISEDFEKGYDLLIDKVINN